jgi:hypothetical protein
MAGQGRKEQADVSEGRMAQAEPVTSARHLRPGERPTRKTEAVRRQVDRKMALLYEAKARVRRRLGGWKMSFLDEAPASAE